MSNSLSHLSWRRSDILLCLFQCFLSCICFQVSASPPDLVCSIFCDSWNECLFSVRLIHARSSGSSACLVSFLHSSAVSLLFSDHVFAVFGAHFAKVSFYCFFPIFQSSPASQCWRTRGLFVWLTFSTPFIFLSTSAMIGLWSDLAVDLLIRPCVSEKPIL